MDLRRAIENGQVVPFYQPKIALDSNTLLGVEVLSRWVHPARGTLRPNGFMWEIDRHGLMAQFSRAVIDHVMRDFGVFATKGIQLGISFNVSRNEMDDEYLDYLDQAITANGLTASHFTLELPDAALLEPDGANIDFMRRARLRGFRVCVDNSVTNNASDAMSLLGRVEVDEIKVDSAKLQAAQNNPTVRDEIRTTLIRAAGLNVDMLAKCIEAAEVERLILDLGFRHAQGYFYGRPMSAMELIEFIRNTSTKPLEPVLAAGTTHLARAVPNREKMRSELLSKLQVVPPSRILIVDDMATNRALMGAALGNYGHSILEATNGRQALELLANEAVDCVILDQMMPEMSGIEVLRNIRKKHSPLTLPVLIVTAIYDTDLVLEALQAGANDYINKPFEFDVARARIEAHLVRKAMGDRLLEAMQDAERASKAKTEYINVMSHEMRTPLNGIVGFAQLAQEELAAKGSPQASMYVNRILDSGNQLLALINGLLDLAKIESGKLAIVVDDFEITTIIDYVAASTEPLMRKNGNTFSVSNTTGSASMHSDRMRLQQILLNLLSNAAKFAQNGQIALGIESFSENSAPWYRFTVTDDGIGMSAAEVDLLFQKFNQANERVQSQFGGSGLGLAITKELCTLLGGHITVSSEKGQGSKFTVSLPAHYSSPHGTLIDKSGGRILQGS